MESDYDYWWYRLLKQLNTLKLSGYCMQRKAFDSLLKCVQNLS